MSIATAIGLGVSAFGLYEKYQAGQQQGKLSKAQAAAANRLGKITAEASAEQAELTREQEALRREEARSNFVRSRRNMVRQGQIARATGVTSAANAGGLNTSSFVGGQAQITAGLGSNLTALNEAYERGEQNFDINAQIVDSQELLNRRTGRINAQQANIQTQMANAQGRGAFGGALFGIGSQFMGNAGPIDRVFNTAF